MEAASLVVVDVVDVEEVVVAMMERTSSFSRN